MAAQLLEKVIRSRGPGKRQIKPAKRIINLEDIADIVSTSSDDDDFQVDVAVSDSSLGESDDEDANSKDASSNASTDASHRDNDETSASGESEHESESPTKSTARSKKPAKRTTPKKPRKPEKKTPVKKSSPKRGKHASKKQSEGQVRSGSPPAITRRTCCVCLNMSEAKAALLECKCCHILIHASCYRLETASGEQSNVSESWLCAVCQYEETTKVHVCNRFGNVDCEMCPSNGGAYFMSADYAGHFVHAVCAVYTPGVKFIAGRNRPPKRKSNATKDAEKEEAATKNQSEQEQQMLPTVSLTDVISARVAARACMLCEDLRFAWTGFPISCDAGLCRATFHATCALRSGLLVEPHSQSGAHLQLQAQAQAQSTSKSNSKKSKKRNGVLFREPAADNVAYCRQHSNSEDVRRRRRAFLTCAALNSKSGANGGEFEQFALVNVVPSFGHHGPVSITWTETDDSASLRGLQLHSSASLVKRFYRKAALLDHDLPTSALPTRVAAGTAENRGVTCVRKSDLQLVASALQLKSNFGSNNLPTFTPGFVERYFERNALIADEHARLTEATADRCKLQEREATLRVSYDSAAAAAREARARTAQLCDDLLQIRSGLCGFTLRIDDPAIEEALSTHEARRVRDSATKRQPNKADDSRPAAKQRRTAHDSAGESEAASTPADAGKSGSTSGLFRACSVCGKTSGQLLLVQCDTCRLNYHLACLEPPLSRMPKKSRIYGWQCSQCTVRKACDSDDEKSGANIDVNQPRQLRHAAHAQTSGGSEITDVDTGPGLQS